MENVNLVEELRYLLATSAVVLAIPLAVTGMAIAGVSVSDLVAAPWTALSAADDPADVVDVIPSEQRTHEADRQAPARAPSSKRATTSAPTKADGARTTSSSAPATPSSAPSTTSAQPAQSSPLPQVGSAAPAADPAPAGEGAESPPRPLSDALGGAVGSFSDAVTGVSDGIDGTVDSAENLPPPLDLPGQ